MSSKLVGVVALSGALALTGCSTFRALNIPQASTSHTAQVASPNATGPAGSTSRTSHIGPPAVTGVVWRPTGTPVGGQYPTYVATTRSGTIGLMWMNPRLLSFRFIPGSQYPEGGPVHPADLNPATWVPTLAAAFNGAFKLRDHVGGYYYQGVTVSPLRTGLASMVIDSHGRLSVVQWGRETASVAGVTVVRQNMRLLIDQYRARTSFSDTTSTWGWADHNNPLANRSALGELADGSLVFEYGHSLTAADMAQGLVKVHSRTAIMLDMNLTQPGGFVYAHTTGAVTGSRLLPYVIHAPTVYLKPWIKDFVVALTRP